MFNKLIGGMLVVASTSIYGYMLTKELTNRIIVLKQLKRAFLLLKSEIRYSMETLPDAFINVSNKFNECEKEIGFYEGYETFPSKAKYLPIRYGNTLPPYQKDT